MIRFGISIEILLSQNLIIAIKYSLEMTYL